MNQKTGTGRNHVDYTPRRHLFFRALKACVKLFYPRHKLVFSGTPNTEPALFVGNHHGAYGPVIYTLFFEPPHRTWVINEVCHIKTFPAFARADFWHPKNALSKAFFRCISYILAPIAVMLFKGAEAIHAHFDRRSLETLQESVISLEHGKNIIVFPENRQPFSEYNEEFSEGFVYVAKYYYKQTGKCLAFYPTFACYKSRIITVGNPILFDPAIPMSSQRTLIKNYLRDEMTAIAKSLNK